MLLATIERNGWELENGERRHTEAPESFSIPPNSVRKNLVPGDLVKLIFHVQIDTKNDSENEIERMWVVVTELYGDGYIGRLDNDPDCMSDTDVPVLQCGAEVPFKSEHVIAKHDKPLSEEELMQLLATPSPAPWQRYDA